MLHITLSPIDDFDALGRRWQALEACADGGFFRGWAFLGCQAATRFAGARLLAATRDGQDVALALIGTGGGKAWLNQTGSHVADLVFIERNGLLVRDGHTDVIGPALRVAARRAPLVLSGIDTSTLQAAGTAGWCALQQTRFAPCADIGTLSAPYQATLSKNARAQIRRSRHLYGDTLRLERADSAKQARAWFAELVSLHQTRWQTRGFRGAFAEPAIVDFHTALIDRAWPDGQIDLLRISAQAGTIGFLYNFIEKDRVLSYQSGFVYGADPRLKPGLVCHTLAIETYAARGVHFYDFLGGADRYKKTLASAGEHLHWAILHKPWSVRGLMTKVLSFVSLKIILDKT